MRSSAAPFVSAISSCFVLRNQLDFYGDLVGDDSIPVPILYEAREELDNQRARLEDRLAALSGDRLTLEGQRELSVLRLPIPQTPARRFWVRCRIWPSSSTSNKPTSRGCSNASAKWPHSSMPRSARESSGRCANVALCRPTSGIGIW